MSLPTDIQAGVPPDFPILRARATLRFLEPAPLPAAKGAMIRGAFGYAFQRVSCPTTCLGQAERCTRTELCAYRWVFETPRPANITGFHDLQDIPRPFVITPLDTGKQQYRAGDPLEFELVLFGRGINYSGAFIQGFEEMARTGFGRMLALARLERVEALPLGAAVGTTLYHDGRVVAGQQPLPLITAPALTRAAAELPGDLRLVLATPLAIKAGGRPLRVFDLVALTRSLCFRLSALALFHTDTPWEVDHRALTTQAAAVTITPRVRDVALVRTSTRGGAQTNMPQGGLVGEVLLRGVPPALRALLLLGTLTHAGKACTFGQGALELAPL